MRAIAPRERRMFEFSSRVTRLPIVFGDGDEGGDDGGSGDGSDDGGNAGGEGEGSGLDDVRRELASANKALRNKTQEAERVHGKYNKLLQDLGGEEGLKELRELRQRQQEAENERMRKEGEWDKLETELRKELETRDKKNSELQKRIEDREIEIALVSAAGSEEVNAFDPKQVLRLYKEEFVLKDGQVVHRERFDKEETGKPLSPLAFLKEEKKNKAASNLFRSNLQAGSGAGGGESSDKKTGAVTIKMVNGQISPDEQKRYEEAVKESRPVQFEHVSESAEA